MSPGTLHRRILAVAIPCLVALSSGADLAQTKSTTYPVVSASPRVDPAAYQDLRWRMVGPTRGGRVTAITGVRSEPCTFYFGGTGGGVWKTEDCGSRWRPVTDGQLETGSIGSIAVSETDPRIVYVGTGSAAIRSNVILGRGIYRSADAGRTWQFVGLKHAGQIGEIVIHPTNPDIVWAAALGSPFGPNDERGVFKTTDGGQTWRRTLFVNDETGARVVAIDSSNPNEVYAGMYRAFRKGWDIVSGGPASEGGIYKSRDGGETWTHLSGGLPRQLIGKIDLAVARSNPKVVYAMIEAPGAEGGLYRSDDAGESWRLVNDSSRLRARPFYFHYVDVNPKDENEVWVSELALHKSTDGGRTFAGVDTPHADNHGIWFNPDNPAYAIQGNDGGANVTIDGGRSWSSILEQPTAELYMVSVDDRFPYRLYAPQQDNSTVIVPSDPPDSGDWDHPVQAWASGPGCETGQIQPRPDGRVVWGACKGEVERYSAATGQSTAAWVYPQNRYGYDPDDIAYRFPRQTVILLSPHDPSVVYQASHVVHRTRDEGETWEVISPDLTAHEPDKQIEPGTPITRDITGEEVYSSIYAMAESRLERGVLWVGANDGPVHVSRDGGRRWANVTPKDLPPGGRVQTIDDSPHRKGSAYIAVYRFLREHDLRPYIYATDDYGATWTRLTGGANGIPDDYPTRVVREDPEMEGLLYAGTEFGAFVSFDNGGHWQSLQQNLPGTPVTDIRAHRGDLVISTMGRSFWILDDVSVLRQLATFVRGAAAGRDRRGSEPIVLPNVTLFSPAAAHRTRHGDAADRADRPQYLPAGALLDYYLRQVPADGLALEVLDGADRLVRRFTTRPDSMGSAAGGGTAAEARKRLAAKEGHNRVLWDLKDERGLRVVPGRYTVRLTVGPWSEARPLDVLLDPRLVAGGVTTGDLQELYDLQTRIATTEVEAHQLVREIEKALETCSGRIPSACDRLRELRDRLVTPSIVYPPERLIGQLQNIQRMLAAAEQRPGREASRRYEDLRGELARILTAFAAVP